MILSLSEGHFYYFFGQIISNTRIVLYENLSKLVKRPNKIAKERYVMLKQQVNLRDASISYQDKHIGVISINL